MHDAGTGTTPRFMCPMHPDVVDDHPSDCPLCGMHLAPEANLSEGAHHGHVPATPTVSAPTTGETLYTCPMHPEIVRDHAGRCPICGMHLEPVIPHLDDDSDRREYCAMLRRFWVSVPLSLAVLSIEMLGFPALPMEVMPWAELALASPVVLWARRPMQDLGCGRPRATLENHLGTRSTR